ncbi:MAG: hypothetical protein Q8Q06_01400 [bacterium]|nr:hypothetical protein [bacterium]
MYIPGLGNCSALIHIAVQHPKVVATLGIMGILGLLISPVGPGEHIGSRGIIEKQESAIVAQYPELAKIQYKAETAFREVKHKQLSDSNIRYVLNSCAACTDIGVDSIKNNNELSEEVSFLFFLDLVKRNNYNIAAAKAAYLSQ